jgi:hypothetical protein
MVMLNLSFWQFFEFETYIFPYTNETSVRESSLRKDRHYHLLYTVWSKFFVMEIVPYTTIIILVTVL